MYVWVIMSYPKAFLIQSSDMEMLSFHFHSLSLSVSLCSRLSSLWLFKCNFVGCGNENEILSSFVTFLFLSWHIFAPYVPNNVVLDGWQDGLMCGLFTGWYTSSELILAGHSLHYPTEWWGKIHLHYGLSRTQRQSECHQQIL